MPAIMNLIRATFTAVVLTVTFAAHAHEFWMWADPFAPRTGTDARITLNVGEYFNGDLIGFATENVAAVRRYAGGTIEDLQERILPGAILPELRLNLARPGTHMIAFDSHPNQITLSADKFHAYLHDEGLDAIIRRREAAGQADTPGRERYRRCVKTLVRAGGRSDATFSVRTGQRLEIVPLSDPHALRKTGALEFLLLFDGEPLPASLVKAWHKRDGQTLMIRARSGPDGKVSFNLPFDGGWMLSVVHMIAATDSDDADWDSFWGNLSFALPARR